MSLVRALATKQISKNINSVKEGSYCFCKWKWGWTKGVTVWCGFSLRLTEKWGGKKQLFSDWFIKRAWGARTEKWRLGLGGQWFRRGILLQLCCCPAACIWLGPWGSLSLSSALLFAFWAGACRLWAFPHHFTPTAYWPCQRVKKTTKIPQNSHPIMNKFWWWHWHISKAHL